MSSPAGPPSHADDTSPLEHLTSSLSVSENSSALDPPKTPPQHQRVVKWKQNQSMPETTSSPPSLKSSSSKATAHTKEALNEPLVLEVDQLTKYASPGDWVEAVCGISPVMLGQWASYIKEKKFFDDEKVAKSLKDFCAARTEPSRYLPLSNLINRMLYLVQGLGPHGEKMPGLPSDGPPIHDITFFRNDPFYLATLPEQGNLAAKRKPDIIATRKSNVGKKNKSAAVKWSSLLLYVELKLKEKLAGKLQKRLNNTVDLSTYEYDDVRMTLLELVSIYLLTSSLHSLTWSFHRLLSPNQSQSSWPPNLNQAHLAWDPDSV